MTYCIVKGQFDTFFYLILHLILELWIVNSDIYRLTCVAIGHRSEEHFFISDLGGGYPKQNIVDCRALEFGGKMGCGETIICAIELIEGPQCF